MWSFIARFILRNRIALLATMGALTIFMGYKAFDIQLSYEYARVLPETDKYFKQYTEFRKRFGEDGNVMVIGFEDKDLFQLQKFNDWYQLSNDIRKIDGIEEVVSLGRIYNLTRNDSLQKFDFAPVIASPPASQAQLDSIRDVILSLPFYEKLVFNKETGVTLMAVTFNKEKLNTKNRISMINTIVDMVDAFGKKHNLLCHYSGLPYIRTAITAKVVEEMKMFLVLALVVSACILLVFFRSASAVIFPVFVVAIGVVWSLGIIALSGFKITILSGLIPPLIIVIGIPNSILLLNRYHNDFRKHGNKIQALARTIQHIGATTFLANVTTAIGFGVFYFTHSAILVEFGLIAAANVMITYIISLIFIPSLFSYLPAPSVKHIHHLDAKRLNGLLKHVDHWAHHYRKRIYAGVGIICVVAFIGMLKIKTVGFVVDDLPKKDPIYVDMKFFEKNFNGVLPFEIAIDTKKEGAALSPAVLSKINRLQKELAQYPEFSKPISLIEAVKFSYQAFRGGDPKYYRYPGITELSKMNAYSSSAKGKESMFRSFIDSTKRYTRVSVQMADVGSLRINEIVNVLQPKIDTLFNFDEEAGQWCAPDKRIEASITGNSLIFEKGNTYLLSNLKESLALAIILISVIMFLLFMSFRMIALSIIPSLIPLLITAGIMGFFDIHLKPSTILIFSIAFGIASDQTIYFLTKYRQEFIHHQSSISKTVSVAIRETGVSMVYTALVLFAGFFIFTASDFGGTAALGVLLSVTLLIAMLSNLVLLPAFLLSLEKRMVIKAFSQEPLIEMYDEEEDIENEQLKIKKNDPTL